MSLGNGKYSFGGGWITEGTHRSVFAINPLLTSHHGTVDVGNYGMGVDYILMNVGDDDPGICNIFADVGHNGVRVCDIVADVRNNGVSV